MTTDDGKLKVDFSKIKNVLIAIAAVLGLLLGIVNALNSAIPTTLETLGVSNFDAVTLSGDLNAANVIATTNVTGTSLFVNGLQQSGALKYGAASTVISGTTIAHGVGTTPTVFLAQPAGVAQALIYTQTIYGFGCGTLSCTIGVSDGAVVTYTTVHWLAGK